MNGSRRTALAVMAAMLVGATAAAQSPAAEGLSFADVAALSTAAPVIVRAEVVKNERLGPRDAPDVAPGRVRLLVTATTTAAIVAPGPVPPTISYLVDLPLDARGKPPRPGKRDVLLFLRGGGTADSYVLVDAHGEVPWSDAAGATVRAVVSDDRGGTVPVVTGIASAFRVPGTVPGEAESQFFLATRSGKPVSLVVLTRPGEARRLTIATGDVIDETSARPVPTGTLLWYRLACGLPAKLPASVGAGDELAGDYAFVRTSLGACGRTF